MYWCFSLYLGCNRVFLEACRYQDEIIDNFSFHGKVHFYLRCVDAHFAFLNHRYISHYFDHYTRAFSLQDMHMITLTSFLLLILVWKHLFLFLKLKYTNHRLEYYCSMDLRINPINLHSFFPFPFVNRNSFLLLLQEQYSCSLEEFWGQHNLGCRELQVCSCFFLETVSILSLNHLSFLLNHSLLHLDLLLKQMQLLFELIHRFLYWKREQGFKYMQNY